jgi:ABC-type dipeptide/oligopeptide/nickel transport system permease subunit
MEKQIKTNRQFHQTMRVFFNRGHIVKVCLAIIIIFVLAAILAPVITPYTPNQQTLKDALKEPSAKYWLGTDHLGRDVLTRLLYGSRVSLVCSVLSSIISATLGMVLGLIAGYFSGWIGQIIMRLIDAQLSIPPLILSMVLASAFVLIFGGNLFAISLVIGLSRFASYVRVVNGLVLSIKQNDYIVATALLGQSDIKILFKHLLPNCFPSIIVLFTMNLGGAIMMESSLSFLGIGITPPTAAWGSMVSEGYTYLISNPLLAILPGICVLLIVVAFNILGDAVRDALDPRLRGKL